MVTIIITVADDGSAVGHLFADGALVRTAIGDTVGDVLELLDQ